MKTVKGILEELVSQGWFGGTGKVGGKFFDDKEDVDKATSHALAEIEGLIPKDKEITAYKDGIDLPTTVIIGEEQGWNAFRKQLLLNLFGEL